MNEKPSAAPVFLVIGACGGLGAAVVQLLSGRATVFAADIDERGLSILARTPSVVPVAMDVRDGESVARGAALIRHRTDRLRGLVYAAGVFRGGPIVELREEDLEDAMEVNVMGVFRAVRELFPVLRTGGGRIVLVSSESTRTIMPFTGPYAMSKRALEALADALRREVRSQGVRVSVIQPGAMRTPLLDSAGAALGQAAASPAFAAALGRARDALAREKQTAVDPARVARLVLRALEARSPRLLYRVANDPLRAALSLLPGRAADALVARFLWPPKR